MMFTITEPRTREVIFENVILSRDSATLEQLKELSSKRKAIEESVNKSCLVTAAIAREMSGGLACPTQQDILKLEQYLPLLVNLVYYIDKTGINNRMARWVSALKIRWSSSTLISSSLFHLRGPKFYQVDNILFELGMSLFLYGTKLRQRAIEIRLTDPVQSATLYREAAGVFYHLAREVLPPLQPSLSAEKPPELVPSVGSALSLLCLAEGQAVTVGKAEEKGSSAGLLAKLHYGIAQLTGEAMAALCSGNGDCKEISSRFLEYISSLGALHELKGQKHLAQSLKSQEKLGFAIGVLGRASANARKKTPRDESWKPVFKKETEQLDEMWKKFEREIDFTWREKIPRNDELPLPQGNKIVNVIPYRPKRREVELSFKI